MNTLVIDGNKKFTLSETGIEFHADLTKHEWIELGEKLARVGKSIGFIIGDWINYGEKQWGQMYAEAIEKTGFDYGTLRVYAHVARRVELLLRNNNLDFIHHSVIAKLKSPDDQKKWLDAAEKHKLSARRLRVSINKGRVVGIDEMDVEPADRGRPTYMTWLNKLLHWWTNRIKNDPVDKWEDQDRQRLKRDLEPWVKIYNEL